ncbi:AIPR family protein [Anaerorudis cellulosivorans]|uniref:AIPR family protein n=1 Tax=Anaerorudis cellulosivorans TaxID=3397862 RepID=UPI00221EBB07|nr:AIPR family protein [Seramator thermalis]MCW1735109.1 AIPR family protein [Seramator thermalis]
MNEIEKYYTLLLQDIRAMQSTSEEGETQEQLFTQIAIEILAEAGETENATPAYDEKELGTKKQHKINGYSISDNYEEVCLFISIFQNSDTPGRISKDEIDRAAKRVTNFFRKAFYNDYSKEIEETSPVFQFAHDLAQLSELREMLVRVKAIILTNGIYNGEIPKQGKVAGQDIYYNVFDINRLYTISEKSHIPIELDFEEMNILIPCLKAPMENIDYESYIAIMPGQGLAMLYKQFGSRLLEQNVRSFLQFTGKINKGIRRTINELPHMFLAYNNGIAATADYIELDETGRYINKISNLQIVNGGQTTASIYHTWDKDKADISNIFVQMKISVIKKIESYNTIVSEISKYANTQNKVNDADFSANNEILIELEKISRRSFSPVSVKNPIPTIWFFERANGQYRNLRLRDGFTKARQKQFDLKYPRKQMFKKTDLAKFVNSYNEVYEGKKLVIGPNVVVRGNEKNYAQFIAKNLPKKVTGVYFEDVIAKFILFREAERLYGIKPNNIGEMRNAVVPYAIALLGYLTDYKLSLEKIWKNQSISEELAAVLYSLMKQLNDFILQNSPSSHYIEWAKKEECWETVKKQSWILDSESIKADFATEEQLLKRKSIADDIDENTLQKNYEISLLRSIPYALWKKIEQWGKDSGFLSINQQSFASFDMANAVKYNREISDINRKKAMIIYEIVCEHNIDLLSEADELTDSTKEPDTDAEKADSDHGITIELVKKMVEWDKRRRILKDWQWKVMNDIVNGKYPLNDRYAWGCRKNLEILKKHGFTID